jgi:hypothetical protein
MGILLLILITGGAPQEHPNSGTPHLEAQPLQGQKRAASGPDLGRDKGQKRGKSGSTTQEDSREGCQKEGSEAQEQQRHSTLGGTQHGLVCFLKAMAERVSGPEFEEEGRKTIEALNLVNSACSTVLEMYQSRDKIPLQHEWTAKEEEKLRRGQQLHSQRVRRTLAQVSKASPAKLQVSAWGVTSDVWSQLSCKYGWTSVLYVMSMYG